MVILRMSCILIHLESQWPAKVYLWPAFVAVARKKLLCLFPECHKSKETQEAK